MSDGGFAALLDRLQVPRGGRLYIQSSTDWIAKAGFGAGEVLAGLDAWAGSSGTQVMPAYPCRTTHLEYLETHPVFDVRRTPSGLGLIPEVFRRRAGAARSLDPDFCIAAVGPDAAQVTATSLEEDDPFGPASTYERLLAAPLTLLGLGVSLNTNSFIHVIDSRFQSQYRQPVYGGSYEAGVIDAAGVRHHVRRRALSPAFQRHTKPSAIAAAVGDDAGTLTTVSINGAQFFRWDMSRWAAWCQSHAASSVRSGRLPCWLSGLEAECATP